MQNTTDQPRQVSKHSVLIIDSDKILSSALSILLESNGYRSVVLRHPDELLPALREGQFDLVLLECHHPDCDSVEVLKQLKEFDSDIAVVMMSDRDDPRKMEEVFNLGTSDFLRKPFEADDLLRKIEEILMRYAVQQVRCDCGNLLAVKRGGAIEIKCRRCKKIIRREIT